MIDPARNACAERCAEVGDPPCYDVVEGWQPCVDCLRDIGVDVAETIDPNAACGLLI